MPPAARKKQQYECAAKEFELTREAMRALNIEADFKGLPLFETWSRYTERRQDNVITDNRRHNKNRIARAKAAAAAAAASEAGSSQAGPSVRDRSNTRSPLAVLTTRCLAQRAGTLAGLAALVGCRARDGELAHGRRHASAAFEFAGAHPRQVRRAARPDEAARGLPHRVQQEGEFVGGEHLRSCV